MSKVVIDGIDCYGVMSQEQNIDIVCDNEYYDGIHAEGFDSWEEAIEVLQTKYKEVYPNILQLEAI